MGYITGLGTLSSIDLYNSTTTVPGGLYVGAMAFGAQGQIYRFGLVGGVTLVVGNVLQSPVEDTTYENMAVLASAIATAGTVQTVNITNGTATITSPQYEGGSVSVYTTPDAGSEYTILGVTGTLTSGGALTVTIDRPLQTAWTTSTKVNMKRNPWNGMIQAPTTQTGIPVGVAMYAAANATYTWVQTRGMCAVLSDSSTYAVGSEVGTPCANTAGAPAVYAAGTTHSRVGTVLQAQASTHWVSIYLQID